MEPSQGFENVLHRLCGQLSRKEESEFVHSPRLDSTKDAIYLDSGGGGVAWRPGSISIPSLFSVTNSTWDVLVDFGRSSNIRLRFEVEPKARLPSLC